MGVFWASAQCYRSRVAWGGGGRSGAGDGVQTWTCSGVGEGMQTGLRANATGAADVADAHGRSGGRHLARRSLLPAGRPTALVCSLFSPSTRFLRSIKLVVTRARRLAMLGETRAVPCVIMDALQLLQGPHGFFESLGVEHGHSTGLLESSAGVAKDPATRALRLLIPKRSPGSGDILTLLHPFILLPSVREIRKSEWIVCDASTLKLFVPPCAWLDSALCRVFCGCRAAGLCDQGLFQACSRQVGARVNFAPVADVAPYPR